ncbi:cytoplasmic polyadenylation element-binding protein 4-like [Paramacrobiotus metropolitanus]|uniref:cytoplasmic polyadenylation element-binding protein 4-like n=1 Tax=Paramacrobiotus metropolitanus TaxID=2943436 RepID=UPI0024457B73|nr:cytoplasmic polyadenylation element-binding protein 4-like [Paramacrobiotus metropolitanus]
MELGVETAFRSYGSPFDYSCSSESPALSSYCTDRSTGMSSPGSRLFQLSPDMLSSIWSSESKDITSASEALALANSAVNENSPKDSLSPPVVVPTGSAAAAAADKEEKSMSFPANTNSQSGTMASSGGAAATSATGRESSSPLSGAGSTGTASSSASSSLEISGLELGNSLFGDSVWSSKGSFNDVGSFGSNDEEKRFLEQGSGKSYLKPPGSAPGSAGWGSFWSDLSPSLSPSNSESNLQHFGSPHGLANPFTTWNNVAPLSNRRSAPPNACTSPFSSGSVSPISRKQLSPGSSMAGPASVTLHQHSGMTQQQAHYRQVQSAGYPVNTGCSANNGAYSGHINSNHRAQYRRSASHPANGHVQNLGHNSHHHHHHVPGTMGGDYINGIDSLGASFYDTIAHNHTTNGDTANFSLSGWNMDPAPTTGYNQNPRNFHQGNNGSMSGFDSLKYSLEPHLTDMLKATNGWDDSGKGRNFFGNYNSYDGSRFGDILDPFDQIVPSSISPMGSRMSPRHHSSGSEFGGDQMHLYSRKVFVGGLPPDIDEEEITTSFRRFGPLIVDWPHKAESKSYFPPKGYAFLLFQDESSVHALLDASVQEGDKLYVHVSSPTSKDKPVQIRPWRLTDNECYLDTQSKLDPRLTVFVGGVPRPLKAHELALLMNQRFGYVAYAGIDVDSELKYPKGAGRITFSNQQSYIAAINARFVQLQNGEIDKRVELKPYVLDDQICDYCHGMKCSGRSAPLFCSQVGCLAYLCEHCWGPYHASPGKDHHKPVTKESSVDRSRPAAMRW